MPARSLVHAVSRFAALLRRQSLPISPLQTLETVRALDHLDIGDRQEIYLGLRALLVTRPEERPIFDRCFESFWRTQVEPDPLGQALAGPEIPEDMADAPIDSQGSRRERLALEGWGEEEQDEGGDPLSVPAASEQEALAARDLAQRYQALGGTVGGAGTRAVDRGGAQPGRGGPGRNPTGR